MKNFLRTKQTSIISADNQPITLKGVNLGGWLMMEGYILHSLNVPEKMFKENFKKALGNSALHSFTADFRNNFIRERDFKALADFGLNCLRVPFHHRLVEKTPYRYDKEGLSFLDRAVTWARKYHLWIILDLHAAPGAQNHDWHSDSDGKANLWQNKDFQKRTFALWEFLADRYKEEETIAGYDLLNESVLDNMVLLNAFYKNLICRIRGVDKNHILFVEGNKWAMDLECLDEFDDDNLVLSAHAYQPLDFTFNFVPHLKYPFKYQGVRWDKDILQKSLIKYAKIITYDENK